ncbi:hypothetical protein GQ464_016820 [Rhodocaloribacter litoris]|uniref:hypothetical protein n=1 Tax=Rhodocaloribacter litoris TaxID=2558931 RepID=UPI00141ECCC2|nr:hypothetical protein [Rhodocaloribacter litoris]QXD15048.1 hypothetical protein GQ464_016820 [Rhodocaloribacter litoris]
MHFQRMTRLALSREITSALDELEERIHRLRRIDLEKRHTCRSLLDEITHLYAAVALCRTLTKRLVDLEEGPALHLLEPQRDRAPAGRLRPPRTGTK